jgi:flagellar biosynthesis/type III secretory pathway chaperone
MNGEKTCLKSRIESCRGLLEVFQQERQMLQARQDIDPSSILGMLKLKLRLVDSMAEHQHAVQAETQQLDPADSGNPQRREHVRELASLLEQLLVIERENQLLLRRLLDPVRDAAPARPAPVREPEPSIAPLLGRLQQIRNREPRPLLAREMPHHAEG